MNKKILVSLYLCDAISCQSKSILSSTKIFNQMPNWQNRLFWKNLKRHINFSKSVSIILYYKSMLQFFLFLGIIKNNFSSIFSHFCSYLISLQTFEIHFQKLFQHFFFFYRKIYTIGLLFWLTIWYPILV